MTGPPLLPWDMALAERGGLYRGLAARERRRTETYGEAPDPDGINVAGYAAEVWAGWRLGLPHWGVNEDLHAPADLGANVQVRATAHVDGHLWVYPANRSDHWYVLVTGNADREPWFAIRGAMLGADAKRRKLHRLPSGYETHWVPQGALHAIVAWDGTRYPAVGLEERPPLVVAVSVALAVTPVTVAVTRDVTPEVRYA